MESNTIQKLDAIKEIDKQQLTRLILGALKELRNDHELNELSKSELHSLAKRISGKIYGFIKNHDGISTLGENGSAGVGSPGNDDAKVTNGSALPGTWIGLVSVTESFPTPSGGVNGSKKSSYHGVLVPDTDELKEGEK